MIKIDEIDFFAFEGCSESEFTELLGKKPTGYNDWIINIKTGVEWVFYDGRFWLDFRKSKEGIRCISCSILYHDKSKGRIDVLFSEGIADRGLKNTGGVLIQKTPAIIIISGNICFRKKDLLYATSI
ncbi:hypothetical protein HMPREF0986_01079 [Escherichia coli 4_1_47FAA]|nr:hypothetical protein HMPREF0986_01079 [Escherichia coli 4_1_47FAA]